MSSSKSKALKKVVAVGIGYKNPRHTKDGLKGTKYEYPIYSKKHVKIIKSAGGKIKE